ncbi:hypothetical protein C8R47DRAFT_1069870 [Mycena vitilis]|nr:hypothetical protein C8R47DRAFT_1069870 [Mycena vitilis]
MAKVIKALPFRHITHLDLRLATYPRPLAWRTALKLLPSLETAYIQANLGAIHFLNALIEVEQVDTDRKTYRRLSHLHLLAAVWDKDDDSLGPLLALLQTYLQHCKKLGTPLPIFEIEEHHFSLSKYEKQLEDLFPLVGNKMIRNGKVYDPVKIKEEHEAWLVKWRIEMAELGIVWGHDPE